MLHGNLGTLVAIPSALGVIVYLSSGDLQPELRLDNECHSAGRLQRISSWSCTAPRQYNHSSSGMASQWTTTGRHSPSHLEVASPHPNPCTHSTRTPARLAPPSLIEFPAAVSGEIPHRAQGTLISNQRAAEVLQVYAVAGSCSSGSGSYSGSGSGSGTDVEEGTGDVWLQEPGYHHTIDSSCYPALSCSCS